MIVAGRHRHPNELGEETVSRRNRSGLEEIDEYCRVEVGPSRPRRETVAPLTAASSPTAAIVIRAKGVCGPFAIEKRDPVSVATAKNSIEFPPRERPIALVRRHSPVGVIVQTNP